MKRLFSAFLFLVVPALLVQAQTQTKPHIILVMVDDLGYGDLGCYGQEQIRTPHIDALADEGIRFTDFYAGSTVCAPSREAILTGMHTGHTFVKGNFDTGDPEGDLDMPGDKQTMGEYMKTAGYRTAVIGKWGVGSPGNGPNTQGFDYSLCYLDQISAHNYYPPHLFENEKEVPLEGNRDGAENTYSHDVFVDKTLDFIRDSGQQPFFLYLPYTIPHGKHVVPDDAPYSEKDWKQPFKNYAAMITRMDRDIGRILQLLEEKGIAEHTVVIFTSDNGANPGFARFFNSNGALRGAKRDLYDGGIRVPLIVRWPGKIKPGRTSGHVSAAWDFLPTLCEIAGEKAPPDVDGLSFLPELLGDAQPAHDFLFWEYYEYNWNWGKSGNEKPRNWLESRAVRHGKWKAVKTGIFEDPQAPVELYDLETDPAETRNVAGEHPEIVKKAEAYFTDCCTISPYFPYKE